MIAFEIRTHDVQRTLTNRSLVKETVDEAQEAVLPVTRELVFVLQLFTLSFFGV